MKVRKKIKKLGFCWNFGLVVEQNRRRRRTTAAEAVLLVDRTNQR
jgi:hypothetical protein